MASLDEVFEQVERANFMTPEYRHLAEIDEAMPIGHGQTISQPYTVRKMLEWLDVRPGQKVLDVGSGSGWSSALLAKLVGPKGRVYAVERVPELLDFGRANVERAGARNVEFQPAGDELGLPAAAPFDRILVSAAADKLPKELLAQLEPGGKMVIPVHNDILEISQTKADTEIKKHPGFVFVPLI